MFVLIFQSHSTWKAMLSVISTILSAIAVSQTMCMHIHFNWSIIVKVKASSFILKGSVSVCIMNTFVEYCNGKSSIFFLNLSIDKSNKVWLQPSLLHRSLYCTTEEGKKQPDSESIIRLLSTFIVFWQVFVRREMSTLSAFYPDKATMWRHHILASKFHVKSKGLKTSRISI